MPLVNLEHDFSIVESPDPFGAGTLIPINKHLAEKGSGYKSSKNTLIKKSPYYSNQVTSWLHGSREYRIAENVGGGKLWRIRQLATNSAKFYPPIACNI